MSKTFRSFKPGIPALTTPPRLAVCVVSNDRGGVHWAMAASLPTTDWPVPPMLIWLPAGGGMLAEVRNEAVRRALSGNATHVLFIDDDHVWRPDAVRRLMEHRLDIVSALYCQRRPPFRPLLPSTPSATSPEMTDAELQLAARLGGEGIPLNVRGLVEVSNIGCGFALIDTRVFKALSDPWFQFGVTGNAGGEDTWFCLKARRAGFSVFVDTDTEIGHLTTCAVWPQRDQAGRIGFDLKFDSGPNALR